MPQGKAHKYGDNIDTDVIIPARYCTSIKVEELAPHALEDLDPTFVKKVKQGDVLVAGKNFGCGSSREVAPITIKGAGVALVIAESFARIFYRNSINVGMPIMECPEAAQAIKDGATVEFDLATGIIRDVTSGKEYKAAPFPAVMQEIINLGGMANFVKKRLAEKQAGR
jgi:3-isopropylmalate/(R)-2-methylmalate dehydratase small subunit